MARLATVAPEFPKAGKSKLAQGVLLYKTPAEANKTERPSEPTTEGAEEETDGSTKFE